MAVQLSLTDHRFLSRLSCNFNRCGWSVKNGNPADKKPYNLNAKLYINMFLDLCKVKSLAEIVDVTLPSN